MLDGKKILLFSLLTFNYEKLIAEKLRSFGAIVDFYDERPTNSLFTKAIIRLKRDFYQKRIDKYYKSILKDIATVNYDFLFVITGEVIPEFFLQKFKQKNPECFCIYYTWDSFTNCSHPLSILNYFDKCFTFDLDDAKKYNLNFRPLFFADQFGELRIENNEKYKYNLLFVGTAHSDRYRVANTIVNWCEIEQYSYFAYYFIQSRFVFLYKRIFDPTFKKINYFELKYKSLGFDEVLELFRTSEVVLDINHPNQNGLTMRTFEALGAGKKLITTNNAIKMYSFYNENNVFVIDRDKPTVVKDFFETPFIPIIDSLKFNMSLFGWINELFLNESDYSEWIIDNYDIL